MKLRKLLAVLLLLPALGFAFASCTQTGKAEGDGEEIVEPEEKGDPVVTMSLSNGKQIRLELYPEIAPISVENFVGLAEQGFYDGLIFHRIVEDFVIQGGGYYIVENNLHAMPAAPIKGEFAANGVENPLSHTAGVISMARAGAYNSATSQFFICTSDKYTDVLDGNYAAFGKVMDEASMNAVLEIAGSYTYSIGYGFDNFPLLPVSITEITVEYPFAVQPVSS